MRELLTLLPQTGRARVLDLGCGPGVPTARDLAAAGHDVVGIDISAAQITLARRNVPTATFMQGDMLSIELPAGGFDAVVALYSITHVRRERYADVLARVRDWLVVGGRFLATFGTGDSSGWFEEDLLGLGATNWTNSYDVETTHRLLVDAGFELDVAEVVEQHEPTGVERWFRVLARRR